MRFGIDLPISGPYADAKLLAALAHEAEAAGWDGCFVYDQITEHPAAPVIDPWIALAAMALNTQRIRLGTLVTPLARRRPWKVARETATLDQISRGRLVLGVGLGDGQHEWDDLGEAADPKVRAALLDEGLDVIVGLWRGEPFSYNGQHYQITHAQFLPPPVQTPRIPIWVGGVWPNRAPMRRAARWDGVFPHYRGPQGPAMLPPDELRALLEFIDQQRTRSDPFDVILRNKTPSGDLRRDAETAATYADAGLTWWLEGVEGRATLIEMRRRIAHGPPRS